MEKVVDFLVAVKDSEATRVMVRGAAVMAFLVALALVLAFAIPLQ